ncbi:metalloregulator ArsR/SmtB family transcription factor [Devosia sp.]|uniref:ArsR/SmtB family transcription factor n=1 Tax=Devosia sp. TaxID=1871048 RepID=UPI002930DB56|nr:metalloregulator ArsR/SmtB family transcription factor [Devosia sp.]
MESTDAIAVFAALSQPTRLAVFRLLMLHEPDGVPAGMIAAQLDVPQNTLSTHLSVLNRAGLIAAERHGRSISYRAELHRVREITTFLVRDCCDGRPELCEPVIADLTPCCSPKEASLV